jgi:ABC-type sugar transport system substrate-binding protein
VVRFGISRRRLTSALGLALGTLLLTVAACGGNSAATGTTKTYRIAVVLPTISINILHDVYQGTLDEAKKIGHIQIAEAADLDTTAFLNDCQRLISEHVDALLYDSIDASGHAPCIQQAKSAGIKVVCLVACVNGHLDDATVTIDAVNDGKLQGGYVAKAIGSGEVGFLEGAPGDTFGLDIGKGFREAIAGCSGCKMVADVPGGVDRNTAYTTSLQVLTAHPNIKAIAGSNDDVGLGIVKGVQQQGKLGQVLSLGHGGSCSGLQSILQNQLSFTVVIPGHATGVAGIDAAWKLINKQSVPSTKYIQAVGLDTKMANAILAGSQPNPSGIDLKAGLQQAKKGC